MAEKPPYFPMYPKDLIGDDLVRVMDTTEFGAYVRLLCAAWVATPPCTIPGDDDELARLAGVTPEQWKEMKKRVLRPWKPSKKKHDEKRYVQKRLLKEFRAAKKRSRAAKMNGKKGGRPRTRSQSGTGDDGDETRSFRSAKAKKSSPEPYPSPEPNGFGLDPPNPPGGNSWETELAHGLHCYAKEKLGLDLAVSKLRDLALDNGWLEVTQALEHRASMKPHRRWKARGDKLVSNPMGVLVKVIQRYRDGDGPEYESDVETYQEWRARRSAEVSAVGGKP